MTLAIHGGSPIRTEPWPAWPIATEAVEKEVLKALHSGQWAISGPATDHPTFESTFARDFAAFNQVDHCIPTSSGSTALMCALQALDVGYGDEVIVPGLTWVACASAVVALNAIPVLVDVDRKSFCMKPEAVKQAITPKTKCIMVVHLYAGIADMDALLEISRETGVPLLEDCSQAHGSQLDGKRVGSMGAIGVFSMQQGKVLTCGEGGACITNHPELANRIYRLRTDGRQPRQSFQAGQSRLEEVGGVLGQNFCLSEIHAAILVARLRDLDRENAIRQANVTYLRQCLAHLPGITFQQTPVMTDSVTLYHFPFLLDPQHFAGLSNEVIAAALSAELGLRVQTPYKPLTHHPLYTPLATRRIPDSQAYRDALQPNKYACPNADWLSRHLLLIHHAAFLGDQEDMHYIAAAFEKVQRFVSA
jgi:dTDP-4-amino-4,6-dideoxygalactose transaminase